PPGGSERSGGLFEGLTEYEQGLAIVLAVYLWRFAGVNIRDSLEFGFKTVILLRPDHPHIALREEAEEALLSSRDAFAESNSDFVAARDEFMAWIMRKSDPNPPDGFER